jgi:hypothetical protein
MFLQDLKVEIVEVDGAAAFSAVWRAGCCSQQTASPEKDGATSCCCEGKQILGDLI